MKKLQGFALIELMIVVAIIAILAAVVVSAFLDNKNGGSSNRSTTSVSTDPRQDPKFTNQTPRINHSH